jgi:hypothetical protein
MEKLPLVRNAGVMWRCRLHLPAPHTNRTTLPTLSPKKIQIKTVLLAAASIA